MQINEQHYDLVLCCELQRKYMMKCKKGSFTRANAENILLLLAQQLDQWTHSRQPDQGQHVRADVQRTPLSGNTHLEHRPYLSFHERPPAQIDVKDERNDADAQPAFSATVAGPAQQCSQQSPNLDATATAGHGFQHSENLAPPASAIKRHPSQEHAAQPGPKRTNSVKARRPSLSQSPQQDRGNMVSTAAASLGSSVYQHIAGSSNSPIVGLGTTTSQSSEHEFNAGLESHPEFLSRPRIAFPAGSPPVPPSTAMVEQEPGFASTARDPSSTLRLHPYVTHILEASRRAESDQGQIDSGYQPPGPAGNPPTQSQHTAQDLSSTLRLHPSVTQLLDGSRRAESGEGQTDTGYQPTTPAGSPPTRPQHTAPAITASAGPTATAPVENASQVLEHRIASLHQNQQLLDALVANLQSRIGALEDRLSQSRFGQDIGGDDADRDTGLDYGGQDTSTVPRDGGRDDGDEGGDNQGVDNE